MKMIEGLSNLLTEGSNCHMEINAEKSSFVFFQ